MAAAAAAPLPAFVSSQRIKDFITLAYSTKRNRRSLEGYWYPAYTQTLSDLTNVPIPNGSLSAAQQFYLSLSSERLRFLEILEDEELDDDDHGTDDGHVGGDDDGQDELANLSMETAASEPDKNSMDKFPDIMVSHIEVLPRDMPPDPETPAFDSWDRRMGARAFHQCFPLIGELKKPPGRKLRNAAHDKALKLRFGEAIADNLITYCAMHFDRDVHSQEVICVRGAGGWWQWTVIKRQHAFTFAEIDGLSKHSPEWVDACAAFETNFDGRPSVYLGKPESDQEWMALRTRLLQILDGHAAQYPAPPQ